MTGGNALSERGAYTVSGKFTESSANFPQMCSKRAEVMHMEFHSVIEKTEIGARMGHTISSYRCAAVVYRHTISS
jgi:hypothetical protein